MRRDGRAVSRRFDGDKVEKPSQGCPSALNSKATRRTFFARESALAVADPWHCQKPANRQSRAEVNMQHKHRQAQPPKPTGTLSRRQNWDMTRWGQRGLDVMHEESSAAIFSFSAFFVRGNLASMALASSLLAVWL